MRIDRDSFFSNYRNEFGALNQGQVDGLNAMLDAIEGDTTQSNVKWIAYELATTKHECADRWHPIEEFGKGAGRPYGAPDPTTGETYYGRGYVQVTWKANYQKLTDAWNAANAEDQQDFVTAPAGLLEPKYAYFAMSFGMQTGLFTGKKLANYIHDDVTDYVSARRIINAQDKAQLIASYATKLEAILTASMVNQDAATAPGQG